MPPGVSSYPVLGVAVPRLPTNGRFFGGRGRGRYDGGMKRAAVYARVSTVDRGQDPETQLRQLREYAGRRGFSLTREYVDHASGTRNDQAEYRAMLEDARKRRFDVLLVWRYDRFARSMRELVNALAEFERSLIGERVRTGMERAKAEGKHTGRPRLPEVRRREILGLLREGKLS